jgi:hypothetical protein
MDDFTYSVLNIQCMHFNAVDNCATKTTLSKIKWYLDKKKQDCTMKYVEKYQ